MERSYYFVNFSREGMSCNSLQKYISYYLLQFII